MADSKFLKFQDKNNDGMIDACDDLPITPAAKCSPECLPNPSFLVPDWKNRTKDEPFLNEKISKYQITIRSKETTTGSTGGENSTEATKALNAIFKEYEEEAIEWLLLVYSKDDSEKSKEKIREIIEYTDFFLAPRPHSKLKLLFSVDCTTLNALDEAEEGDDDEEEAEDVEPVIYEISDLRIKISKVNKGLGLYNRYNKINSFMEGSALYYLEGPAQGAVFDLEKYGYKFSPDGETSLLRQLYMELDRFLNTKGFNMPGGAFFTGLGKDRVRRIEFRFTKNYELKKMLVYTQDCGLIPAVYDRSKLKPLNAKKSWGDPTAVAYFANLDTMVNDLEARNPISWLEYVKKHTYPAIYEVTNAGYTNTDPANTVGSCIANSLIEEGKQLGQDIFDLAFSLGDVIAAAFNKNMCYGSLDELREAQERQGTNPLPEMPDKDLTQDWLSNKQLKQLEESGSFDEEFIEYYKSIRKEAKQTARGEFLTNMQNAARAQAYEELEEMDPAIWNMCMKVLMFLYAPKMARHGGWRNSLGALKWCGLFEILARTVQCLFKGLTLEEALAGILQSALTSMSIKNFGVLFVGLPPDKQQELDALVKKNLKEGNIFKEGSLNQEASDAIAEMNGDPDSVQKPWNDASVENKEESSAKTTAGDMFSGEGYQPTNEKRTLAQQFDGSSGSKLKTSILMQAYVKSLLELYQDNLLDLLDEVNKFPGAPIIFQAIAVLDCPREALFSPDWMDFINSIELPLCRNQNRISWPYMRFPNFRPWWLLLREAIRVSWQEIWDALWRKIQLLLWQKLCELIGSAACKALEVMGDAIESAFSEDTFAQLVRETFCGPDVPDEQVQDTIVELASTLGMGAAALGDTEQTLQFFSDASSVASEREWQRLLTGGEASEALGTMLALVEDEYPDFAGVFKNTGDLAAMFAAVGNTMPTEEKRRLQEAAVAPADEDMPANPSLCATPEKLEEWCKMRQDILEGRATMEQVVHMCEQGRAQNADDIVAFSGIMDNDGLADYIAGNLPPLVSAPGCDDGLTPFESEDDIAVAAALAEGEFALLQTAFTNDMVGSGPGVRKWGMVNMILSDTMGNPLTVHNRKVFFQRRYVDFTIEQEGDPDDDEGFGKIPKTKKQRGAFPTKVGAWLQNYMGSLNVAFSATNDKLEAETFPVELSLQRQLNPRLKNITVRDAISAVDLGYNYSFRIDFEEDKYYLTREPRKKTPDMTLQYFDNNTGLASLGEGDMGYSYGFKLELYISDLEEKEEQWRNVPGSNARMAITDMNNSAAFAVNELMMFSPMAVASEAGKFLRDALDGLETEEVDIEIPKYEFLSFDEEVFHNVDMANYPELAACFESYQSYAPQLVLLKELLTKGGSTVDINALKSLYDGMMRTVQGEIFSTIADNDAAFNYGAVFDDLTFSSMEYVVDDGQTLSPGGTLYYEAEVQRYDKDGNEDGTGKITNQDQILGISRMQYDQGEAQNRVFYLDPLEYGGNYMNPPIYIKPLKNEGWLGFLDMLFPDMTACKPRNVDLIDFEDIKEKVDDTYITMPEDPRLSSDPDCVVELPYNRILERQSLASIQGIIMAAIRIYVTAAMVKSLATFTKFYPRFPETFSSLYASYIVEIMESEFKDAQGAAWEGLSTFKDDEFWYAFLEQSVQMYARRVDSGDIEDPPEDVLRTLTLLNDMQEKFYEGYPDRKDRKEAFWSGETRRIFLKQYREDLKFYAIYKTQEKAKRILKELVIQQLNTMGEIFVNNLKIVGMTPDVFDLDYYLLQNLTQGGTDLTLDQEVKEEVQDIPSEPVDEQYTAGGELYVYKSQGDTEFAEGDEYIGYYHVHIDEDGAPQWMVGEFHTEESHSILAPFASKVIVPIGDVPEYGASYSYDASRPFVIEKYISINGTKNAPSSAISTIKENDNAANLSDYYGGNLKVLKNMKGEEVGLTGKMGVRYGLEFSMMYGTTKVPLTSVEVDALDLPIGQIDPLNGDSKLLYCLLLHLKEDEVFKLVTGYIFPLNKLTATAAIYNDMGFLSSINQTAVPAENFNSDSLDEHPGVNASVEYSDGATLITEGGDTEGAWSHPTDRSMGPLGVVGIFNLKYDEWDQGILRNSKSTIKRMFKAHYNMRDFDDGQDPMDNPAKVMMRNLKQSLKPASGARLLPWFKRRMLRGNPFNADDELCEK